MSDFKSEGMDVQDGAAATLIRVGIASAPHLDVRRLADGSYEIADVTIGKQFHWERRECQHFSGEMEIVSRDGLETVINTLPLEDYLVSVISSEMKATSHAELLKAHAVISRSWALARILERRQKESDATANQEPTDDTCNARLQRREDVEEIIRWYDADGHDGYDVCADDHCQRYQGIDRIRPEAEEAVRATAGEVLMHDGTLCDARFSKCCGGAFEVFSSCWAPHDLPYLQPGRDLVPESPYPDLRDEATAREWIESRPDAFCSNPDMESLEMVLNPYDLERFTPGVNDSYRWEEQMSATTLREILMLKSGIDFGKVKALRALKRGTSGRIHLLEIEGTKRTVRIGKELEIRRWLSRSHLPSSAFVAKMDTQGNWHFRGAGWGHGVGLCQIGAAMMALRGYTYRQILAHYFPCTVAERLHCDCPIY